MLADQLSSSIRQTMRLSLTRSPIKGHDHTVTIRSGEGVLVIVNVFFEPDLVLRNLRERLHRITIHWPLYSFEVIIGDFNICEPEEGRFNVRKQTFSEGDAGKTALFL